MKINPVLLFCLFLLGTGHCFSTRTEEILNNIDKAYSAINDISFGFTQKTTIKMTGETELVAGNAIFKKPDKFRITGKKPREQTIVCDGKKMYLYSKKLNQVVVEEPGITGGGILPRQFFDFSSVVSDLRGDYDITIEKEDKEYSVLSCSPKKGGQEKPNAEENSKIRFWISNKTHLLDKMETSTDAILTQISVSGIKTNNKTGEKIFNFKIPKGADVVTSR